MSNKINLNADLGESFGAWKMGCDAEMLRLIDSANIACGFHAGDPLVMRRTLRLAKENGVTAGAHPSYPDRQGFGRRSMKVDPVELEAMLIYQIAALDGMGRAEGLPITHVKPHGALNNDACADRSVADTVARAIRTCNRELILLAPALSPLHAAGEAAGLRVVAEIFADRAYGDDGQLLSRALPGAVLHDADACYAHVERMLAEQAIVSVGGKKLPCPIGSICIHGDNAEAVATAARLREGLTRSGYALLGLPELN